MFPRIDDLEARLSKRFGAAGAKVEYLRSVTDLQVAKASGLLAFAAIIAALAVFLWDKPDPHTGARVFCTLAGSLSFVAAGLTLRALWSTAPTVEEFSTEAAEAVWLTSLLRVRAHLSNWAVLLSALSALMLALSVLVRLLPDPPNYTKAGSRSAATTEIVPAAAAAPSAK